MALVKNNHVVEQLAAQRAEEPFGVGILPRAAIGGANLFNAAAVQESFNAVAAGGPDRGSSLSGSQCDSTTGAVFYWVMEHGLVG